MTNDLNSILLEGKLAGDPVETEDGERTPRCTFEIVVTRRERESPEGVLIATSSTFTVETVKRLATVCGEYLKAGRGVRVVGRLCRDNGHGAYIAAEHVEFKPQAKTAAREVVGAGTLEE